MTQELIDILNRVKEKITTDSNVVWTRYNTASELRNELEGYVEQLNDGDNSCVEKINIHFLPTSTFQEHSLKNGWVDEYMKFAEKFDAFYAKLKNND